MNQLEAYSTCTPSPSPLLGDDPASQLEPEDHQAQGRHSTEEPHSSWNVCFENNFPRELKGNEQSNIKSWAVLQSRMTE